MKRLLLLLALLAFALPAHATHVQGTSTTFTSQSSMQCAFGSPNSANNLIVVLGQGMNNNTIAISDTQGNTYHQLVLDGFFATTNMFGAWYAEGIKAGSNTVTISWVTAETSAIACAEYSGIPTSGSLDQSGFNTGTGSAASSLSKTTTANHETLIAFYGAANGITATSGGFTTYQKLPPTGTFFGQIADDLDQPIGSYQATGTVTSGKWAVYIATFFSNLASTQVGAFIVGP